ncbi:MAG: deoxyuridine 5'-triphosphate nucleotidohydrolase, partial [Oscillospiraceae bacterium]|nr:deoxyuridine 5'-triphosphate nucleotidohydrolase [Oscillospiraceae bacterium]
VSAEQFTEDFKKLFPDFSDGEIAEIYGRISLPRRATAGSAGYDFFLPLDALLVPGKSVVIPTGIRAKIVDGWVLNLYPRSSLGFKHGFRLENTVGIIDSDYYNADNEGHIMAKVSVLSEVSLSEGKAFMQGVFLPFGITSDDNAEGERHGGFGSSDRQGNISK